jgi:hypothetical protein
MPSDRKRILTGPMAEVVTGSFSDSAAAAASSGANVSAAMVDNNKARAATVRIAD